MNKDGDYSAAYVVLETDDAELAGSRVHLHHRPRQRPLRRGGAAARAAADRARRRRAHRRSRRDLPRAAVATRSCAGSDPRRASSTSRMAAVMNAVWDLAARSRGQAAVATARRHDARAARRCGRPALPLRRAHPRRGDRASSPSWHPTRAAAHRRARAAGRLPLLHDQRRLARLLRRQAAASAARRPSTRATGTSSSRSAPTSRTTSAGSGSRAR